MTRGAARATLCAVTCIALVACGDADPRDDATVDRTQPRGIDASDAPRPLDGVAVPDFDGAAAFTLLERQVAFGPRVAGTPGHAAQLAWMTDWLRERADTLLLQEFTHTSAAGRRLRMTNLIARFRPDASERVLLLAHWDTRSVADNDPDPARRGEAILGANDGASGVAVLLQLADVLSRQAPPVGVDLLLVDGEDYAPGEMYLGARHFAANPAPGSRPRYGVLIDMIGDASPSYPIEASSARLAPDVVRRVYALAREIGYGDVFPMVQGPAIEDDHLPLNAAGIPTIDIIDFDYGPANSIWHTHQDDLNAVSVRGLEAVGSVLTELVYRGG